MCLLQLFSESHLCSIWYLHNTCRPVVCRQLKAEGNCRREGRRCKVSTNIRFMSKEIKIAKLRDLGLLTEERIS